ncbi:hypothetical protein CkaCkLH20_03954 [Colletotrichum karsti]|uniref:Uncharacterized protein n=1 Tax=Colletotrichum karsti TaxID=1095194 RepID=A0A9P6LNF3_9PEZI|nr:uncharacterized protein CkaCkLH20_03954 [Colletotrichum karsti]KAF9878462.1 hypothetical protein CkaCkLH20_03954 [Colletotrichum karsti]
MCRLVLFAGTCTRCNESLTWADLSQQLSCLEAKNADEFGGCRRGVDVETHAFDQECDTCAGEDEGVAGLDFGEQQHHPYYQQYHEYAQFQLQHQQQQTYQQSGSTEATSAAAVAAVTSSTSPVVLQGQSKRPSPKEETDGRRKKRART